ncbi:hypothetical protein Q0L23_01235 [Klebsiella michiganensis]|uniref:hypothetical protein n=1 Tax=Klebsiella TaxID=570 RepID=UPI002658BAD4|nr:MULTISPECIES: hypothetical protein [Klebsiella]WKJ99937.1 hypothetical protein Q0L46_10160 [Klebsiella michiganensis]WKK04106.1 hypothetical protein Q0L23_01235 [Klebsiella michiganensis]HCL6039729.1 hypothetical protein [Klebsiella michiganensis]HED2405089.1 hypothetical protein [Klebsiella michiganensis]HED2744661.1 hypothetical protein [Klebsiella michiganensis]
MSKITSEINDNIVTVFYETDKCLTFQAQVVVSDYNSEEDAIEAAKNMAKKFSKEY